MVETNVRTEIFKRVEDAPVVKSVEKREFIDLHNKTLIMEEHKQDIVEIHEQPVVRKVQHQPVELTVHESVKEVELGKEEAELVKEAALLIDEAALEESDINISEEKTTVVTEEQPEVLSVQKNVTREVHNRKVITEIHEQPVVEIHEQPVRLIVHEAPIIKKVHHEVIYETVNDAAPLLEDAPTLMAENLLMNELGLEKGPVETEILEGIFAPLASEMDLREEGGLREEVEEPKAIENKEELQHALFSQTMGAAKEMVGGFVHSLTNLLPDLTHSEKKDE